MAVVLFRFSQTFIRTIVAGFCSPAKTRTVQRGKTGATSQRDTIMENTKQECELEGDRSLFHACIHSFASAYCTI